ncbi:unnamed protein product [Lactuca virosa]|uniref:Uncharacterized protein n=1 Tax=Lactuca virosa TaxID=75947 RepID=A0AAU9LL74_9ASTR|nr:unnamed protein product [Lactuca virosa]
MRLFSFSMPLIVLNSTFRFRDKCRLSLSLSLSLSPPAGTPTEPCPTTAAQTTDQSVAVCSIQDVYIPALNKTRNSTSYQSIYLDLKLDNENKDKGFYQGHQKKARRKNWTDTQGVPWDAAVNITGGRPPVFRVDLATAVRFKILFWKTKRHKLILGADFEVSDRGQKLQKKGTRLKSGAPPELFSGNSRIAFSLVVFCTLVLVFI